MTGTPEPILKWGSVVALVKVALALLVSFGLPIVPEQSEQIVQLVVMLEPFSVWYLARKHTTPYDPSAAPPQPSVPPSE